MHWEIYYAQLQAYSMHQAAGGHKAASVSCSGKNLQIDIYLIFSIYLLIYPYQENTVLQNNTI